MQLGEIELQRLSEWINESMNILKHTKAEAP